jgi:hypothetical protein
MYWLDDLYEIQRLLVAEMPISGSRTRMALDKVDKLIERMEE